MTIANVNVSELEFRAAIVAAVEGALGALASTTGVSWADGGRELADRRILLSIISSTEEWVHEELPDANTQRVSAQRDVSIQMMAESTFDTGDADARDLLNTLRFGLRRLSVVEALHAAGIGMPSQASAISRFSYLHSGRRVSAHAFDTVFRASFGATFTESSGLLEHVEYSGDVEDDQGATADVGPAVVDDPDPKP